MLIERLLAYAPTNFHLVISARTELPFSMGQLRIHDRVAERGVVALHFTHDETHALLTDRVAEKLASERIRALYDATEGWVAGIQMLAMAWRSNADLQFEHDADSSGRFKLSEAILQSFVLAIHVPGWASDARGSAEEAVSLVRQAADYLKANGTQKAYAAFSEALAPRATKDVQATMPSR